MNKSEVLYALSGTPPIDPVLIAEDQTVGDIMKAMNKKHRQCEDYYDDIVDLFWGNDLYETCENLWNFCKDNFTYKIETLKLQRVSAPTTLLRRGESDCKGYSLFCAGVLDAMRRQGEDIDCYFRFVSQNLFSTSKHHVFVVVNPGRENIWIDPVLGGFNDHLFYFWKKDCVPGSRSEAVGAVGGRVGCTVRRRPLRRGGLGAVSDQLDIYQSGAYYGKEVFDYYHAIPGAGDAFLADPPISYWVNGLELILPDPNKTPGAAVPPLPLGLTVIYAPSFMGLPIPPNMPRPVVVAGNQLQISPLELGSTGDQTNQLLEANGFFLLNILMSAMGTLVNAYSSRPYSNPQVNTPSGAFGTLAHYITQLRNKANFLDPIVEKTFAGEILSAAGSTVLPLLAPVVNVIVPGSGAVLLGESAVLNSVENQNTGTHVLPADDPNAAAQVIPGSGSGSGADGLMSNPWLWVGLAAAVGGFFLLSNSNDHGS
jgi:hypothetical protein